MFKPIKELVVGVDFENEEFESIDLSDERISLLLLKGKTVALGYIRNKDDNWKNILRDFVAAEPIESFDFKLDGAKAVSCYPIWQEDRTTAEVSDGVVILKDIDYGTLFKISL